MAPDPQPTSRHRKLLTPQCDCRSFITKLTSSCPNTHTHNSSPLIPGCPHTKHVQPTYRSHFLCFQIIRSDTLKFANIVKDTASCWEMFGGVPRVCMRMLDLRLRAGNEHWRSHFQSQIPEIPLLNHILHRHPDTQNTQPNKETCITFVLNRHDVQVYSLTSAFLFKISYDFMYGHQCINTDNNARLYYTNAVQ